jgi:hypothetical protein
MVKKSRHKREKYAQNGRSGKDKNPSENYVKAEGIFTIYGSEKRKK